jgi:F-type H+-transporting ATPase subunit delta
MTERTLAKRYASALLDVTEERGEVDRVEQELHALADLWSRVSELRTLIRHPTIARDRKAAALAAALGGKLSETTLRFATVLLEKGRFELIADIAALYDDLSDEHQGIARIQVTTSKALDDAQRAALVAQLQKFTARPRIVLKEAVDPDILGGVIVRFGDQVIDGSIRARLRDLRERLVVREREREAAAQAMVASGGLD